MRPESRPVLIDLPPLPDEAAVEIQDFLQHLLLLFDTHYGNQVQRYYNQNSYDNFIQYELFSPTDDPPF